LAAGAQAAGTPAANAGKRARPLGPIVQINSPMLVGQALALHREHKYAKEGRPEKKSRK